jgi:hypothetical protein
MSTFGLMKIATSPIRAAPMFPAALTCHHPGRYGDGEASTTPERASARPCSVLIGTLALAPVSLITILITVAEEVQRLPVAQRRLPAADRSSPQARQAVTLRQVALPVEQILKQRHDRVLPHPVEPVGPPVQLLEQQCRIRRQAVLPSHRASNPRTGGTRGSSSTNANRRRIAASILAMDRSAVFIVPMMKRFFGKVNSRSGEYRELTGWSRYSRRKYSSPNTLARWARLISSMIRMYGVAGLAAATSAKSRNGPARSLDVSVPLPQHPQAGTLRRSPRTYTTGGTAPA